MLLACHGTFLGFKALRQGVLFKDFATNFNLTGREGGGGGVPRLCIFTKELRGPTRTPGLAKDHSPTLILRLWNIHGALPSHLSIVDVTILRR